jgi:hypothetical protein
LKRFLVERKFTDINLICSSKNETNDLNIPCHKLVLCSFSSYFESMFSHNLIENQTNQVLMPNTDYSTLNEIVNYAYSGSIYLNNDNCQNIMSLANLLCLKELVQACSEFMISQLDVYNSIDVYLFAKHHMFHELENKSKEFINRNINEIFKTNEFCLVNNCDLVFELISSDDLNIQSEDLVLYSLIKWIRFDLEKRIGYTKKLLNAIRFNQIDTNLLQKYIKENNDLLVDHYNTSFTNNNNNKRIGMTKPDYVFLLIGGNCDLEDGFYVNCVNPHTGDKYFVSRSFLEKSKSIKKGFFHLENPGCCVTNDNRIFVCGGNYVYHEYKIKKTNRTAEEKTIEEEEDKDCYVDNEEHLSKETYEYDKINDTWVRRANMLFAKANFTLCSMDDKIYSFGGVTTDQDQLDIVEYYDINQNKWHYIGKMPTAFIAGNVVRFEDKFYIMGGRSGVGRFNKCWQFKPDSCEWLEIKKMKIGRFNFGSCLIESQIYVFGGQRYNESEQSYYTREALDSVEVYNIKTNEWHTAVDMPSPLYNCGTIIYDDNKKCVYICGTTECKYSGSTLLGFMFTSVYRLELNGNDTMKWTVVEHDLTDIKSNYRCIAARLNTRKLYKCYDNY